MVDMGLGNMMTESVLLGCWSWGETALEKRSAITNHVEGRRGQKKEVSKVSR